MGALVLLVGFLFVWPIAMLVIGIFSSTPPGVPGHWTLDTIRRTFSSRHPTALQNSVIYAVTTTALATLLGAIFAFLATRTTVALRRLITPVMLLVFAAPNLFYAISWALLADPGAGLLNVATRFLSGGPGARSTRTRGPASSWSSRSSSPTSAISCSWAPSRA